MHTLIFMSERSKGWTDAAESTLNLLRRLTTLYWAGPILEHLIWQIHKPNMARFNYRFDMVITRIASALDVTDYPRQGISAEQLSDSQPGSQYRSAKESSIVPQWATGSGIFIYRKRKIVEPAYSAKRKLIAQLTPERSSSWQIATTYNINWN